MGISEMSYESGMEIIFAHQNLTHTHTQNFTEFI